MDRPPVVVITGSSAGIGRATAHEFAKRGAKIGLLARNIDGLEGAKRQVEALGGEAICCVCDVTEPNQITLAAEMVEAAFGPIDIWINNAMVSFLAPLKEVTPEEYRRVTDVTYHGVVYGTMEALRRMRPRNAGSIVLVGSALAYRGIPLQTAYCGAKHAIQGFFDSLRAELIHEGSDIQLSMVQLPGVNTTQFKLTRNKMPNKPKPMGKVYEPEVAARGIYYAATHDEREIFVGWPTFQTIWGNKLFPGLGDLVLGKIGVSGQLTEEPADPNARDYLFKHVPGDHGYKGGFGGQATDASPTLWLTMNKWFGAVLVGGIAAAGTALVLKGLGVGNDDSDDADNHVDDRAVGDNVFDSNHDARPGEPRYVDHTVYPDGRKGKGGKKNKKNKFRYPDRDLSGIHGGAPEDFDYDGDEGELTFPGEIDLKTARRRDAAVVLDGLD